MNLWQRGKGGGVMREGRGTFELANRPRKREMVNRGGGGRRLGGRRTTAGRHQDRKKKAWEAIGFLEQIRLNVRICSIEGRLRGFFTVRMGMFFFPYKKFSAVNPLELADLARSRG